MLFASFRATYRNPPTPDPDFSRSFDDSPQSGGIFRRIDGPQPRWEQVYRWKDYDLHRLGRRAADDPRPDRRARPERTRQASADRLPLLPRTDHRANSIRSRATRPRWNCNLKDFFGQAFHGGGRYTGTIRCRV